MGDLFGGGGGTTIVQQAPTPTPPAPMPDPWGPAANAAARKAALGAKNMGGRGATELTTAASRAGNTIAGGAARSAPAGGTPYAGSTLGGGA